MCKLDAYHFRWQILETRLFDSFTTIYSCNYRQNSNVRYFNSITQAGIKEYNIHNGVFLWRISTSVNFEFFTF